MITAVVILLVWLHVINVSGFEGQIEKQSLVRVDF